MSVVAENNITSSAPTFRAKLADYASFAKFRLSVLVVFSAAFGYFIAADFIIWSNVFYLVLGGFLITVSSNGSNEIIERDLDRLMERTKNRPLAVNSMRLVEAYTIVILSGLSGIALLWVMLNPLCGILALLAYFTYVFVYTPLKRISPICVLVGAFPGAIPPMLGWVAATGQFGLEAGILFAIQFIWQFPHFWSIAWVAHKDYERAGFKMLPSKNGKDKTASFLILFYTLLLIPASLLPVMFQFAGNIAAVFLVLAGAVFFIPAVRLFLTQEDKFAKQVMFGSFLYLPILLIALFIDKL